MTVNGVRVRDSAVALQRPKRQFHGSSDESSSSHFTFGLFGVAGDDSGGVLGHTTLRGNPMCTQWLFLHMAFSLAPHML